MQGKVLVRLVVIVALLVGVVEFWRNGIMPEVRKNHPEWLQRNANFMAGEAVAMAAQAEPECRGMTVTSNQQESVKWIVDFDGQTVTISTAADHTIVFRGEARTSYAAAKSACLVMQGRGATMR